MTPEERLGITPSYVAQAKEIQLGRPVRYSEGEYICGTCGRSLDDECESCDRGRSA